MEELLVKIKEIQQYLYGGYKDEGTTNLEWLDVSEKQNCFGFQIYFEFISILEILVSVCWALQVAAQVSVIRYHCASQ